MSKIRLVPDILASQWGCGMKRRVIALGLIALVGCGLWYGLELRPRSWEGK